MRLEASDASTRATNLYCLDRQQHNKTKGTVYFSTYLSKQHSEAEGKRKSTNLMGSAHEMSNSLYLHILFFLNYLSRNVWYTERASNTLKNVQQYLSLAGSVHQEFR